MYVGSVSEAGYHQLLWELVYNSVDEALSGACTRISVTLADDHCAVEDDGRGIPTELHPGEGVSACEVVMTKLHFKSIRKGFMVFVLNFSLSFIRAKAALAATLGIYPSSGWAKGDASSTENKAVRTLRTTVTETTFASALFVLGALALVINNAYGAVWLLWYAVLYSSTFILFYKYG